MLEFFFICGIFGFLFIVLKHLIDKSAYKRKIARSNAELQSRIAEIARSRCENDIYYERETSEWRKTETPQKSPPTPARKHAKPEIEKFLDVKNKTRIIIFDVETNGLNGGYSVLSCSAIKYEIDPNAYGMTEIDRFNRYYYPVEQFDPQAIAVNGLTKEVITEKRGDGTYPEHFCMDSDFETFCSDTKRFIAHNISFDMQFIPFLLRRSSGVTLLCSYGMTLGMRS